MCSGSESGPTWTTTDPHEKCIHFMQFSGEIVILEIGVHSSLVVAGGQARVVPIISLPNISLSLISFVRNVRLSGILQANLAHLRQSRPDSGFDLQAKGIKSF